MNPWAFVRTDRIVRFIPAKRGGAIACAGGSMTADNPFPKPDVLDRLRNASCLPKIIDVYGSKFLELCPLEWPLE